MEEQDRQGFAGTLPVVCQIGDIAITLLPKKFSSGSLGWHGNAKATVHGYKCQCNLILTVVGSKPIVTPSKEEEAPSTQLVQPRKETGIPDQPPFELLSEQADAKRKKPRK